MIRDSLLTGLALAALVAFGSWIPLSNPSSRMVSLQLSSPTSTNQTAAVPQEKSLEQIQTLPLGAQAAFSFPNSAENPELASSSCADSLPEVPCVARPMMASIATLGRRGQALSQLQANSHRELRAALDAATSPFHSEFSGSLPSMPGRPFGFQHPQLTVAPAAHTSAVR